MSDMELLETLNSLLVGVPYPEQVQDKYIVEQRLSSLDDTHTDGSGVCYWSRLRPILNMRPKYGAAELSGSPNQFNADLHLVDGLEAMAHPFDVVIDEDLHHEGEDLLAPYKVLLTDSHPGNWLGQMLDGLESYLNGGASFELDRLDHALGSPPHALLLATASGYSDLYQHVIEEVTVSNPIEGGTRHPLVKADRVHFECPNGGAAFCVSSIAWCGPLSYGGYDNNVARVTGNALKRYASDDPLP